MIFVQELPWLCCQPSLQCVLPIPSPTPWGSLVLVVSALCSVVQALEKEKMWLKHYQWEKTWRICPLPPPMRRIIWLIRVGFPPSQWHLFGYRLSISSTTRPKNKFLVNPSPSPHFPISVDGNSILPGARAEHLEVSLTLPPVQHIYSSLITPHQATSFPCV